MKKIFAFIGSPGIEKSNTFTLTRMMLDRLSEMDPEISHEVFTGGQVKLEFCKGCWTCMTKGFCPADSRDDMGMLKEKMMGADFIIFGSPVYTLTVSGQTKTFLDRLASWYHTLRLAGKPGMTVATTAHDSPEKGVHDLMEMLMCGLGVQSVCRLETNGYFPGVLADPEKAQEKARRAAKEVHPYLSGEKQVESNEDLEMAFQIVKRKSVEGRQWLPADYEYWEKNGMLGLNSYAELLEKIRSGGKV